MKKAYVSSLLLHLPMSGPVSFEEFEFPRIKRAASAGGIDVFDAIPLEHGVVNRAFSPASAEAL